jgi:hypothetical protein
MNNEFYDDKFIGKNMLIIYHIKINPPNEMTPTGSMK